MKNYKSNLARLILASATALTAANLSSSQSSVDESLSEDEIFELTPFEVKVDEDSSYYGTNSISGTRTRTDLSNLAMSMQVLTEDFIKDIAAEELEDIVPYASGATAGAPSVTDSDTSFTLRGISTYLPMRNGFRRLRLVSGANIQQVEILKGPASLLYGQLSPGGTVNYITKRASVNHTGGSASATVGSYNLKRGVVDYNYAILPEKLGVRLVGSIVDAESIEDRYERTVSLFNPTISWFPTENTKVVLDYEVNRRDVTAPTGDVPWNNNFYLLDEPGAIDRSFNTRTNGDYYDTTMRTRAIEVTHKFNDSLTARASWNSSVWQMETRLNSTSSSLNLNNGNIGNRTLRYRKWGSWDTFAVLELVNNFKTERFEMQNIFGYQDAELQFRNRYTGKLAPGVKNPSIRWNIDDRDTWILTELTEDDTVENTGATGNMSTNLNDSYYFTNQMTLLDGKLHTLAGIRVEKLTTDFYRKSNDSHTITEAEDAKVPQFGALYRLNDNTSLYTSYSESFNPAFATLRDENGEFYTPDPEVGEGYDVGVKMEIPEQNISLSAALFSIERTNIIKTLPPIDDPDAPGSTFNPSRQSGLEKSEGFEMDIRWRPSEKLQVIGSYGYTDASVVSDEVNPELEEGHDLGNAPRNTFALFARRNMAGFGPFDKTFFTVGARAVSSRAMRSTWVEVSPGVVVEPPRMEGYELVDLGIGGTFTVGEQEYDLRANIKNAFDEVYLSWRGAFGNPRMLELTLRTKF